MNFICNKDLDRVSKNSAGPDWPSRAPGEFPVAGQLIWPAAVFSFLLLLIFYIFAFSMYQSDNFRFCHTINHKSERSRDPSTAMHA